MAGSTSARPLRWRRRPCAGVALSRRPSRWSPAWRCLVVLAVGLFVACDIAAAQQIRFPQQPPRVGSTPGTASSLTGAGTAMTGRKGSAQEQMLVRANEIQYDYANQRVSAVGNVQIYYSGSTLEADKVTYDQKTKRLHAEGNARLTEADGKITYGQIMDLGNDYRDGFVDSLRLDTPDQTRFAAARARRTGGQFTVFESGVYTACKPCVEDPKRPPLWQVKAARIIHDDSEKMIYFESARIEFLGVPLAYFPYFSTPDPTVKRKTGFLVPSIVASSKIGYGARVPYYWAIAPDYDLTLTPQLTTKQGLLMQGEWRQRLVNGSYNIRAAGIYQLDKDYFLRDSGPSTPGYRDWRGSIDSSGKFSLTDKWVWGWDAVLLSDRTFWQDYGLLRNNNSNLQSMFATDSTEAVSQLYLTGRGDRSFFDVRSIYYYGFSESDTQGRLPIIHPVVDYDYTFDNPVLGGELSYRTNLTSLTRSQPAFDPISQNAVNNGLCTTATADTSVKNPSNCLLRGIPGSYSRFSGEATWRRTFTDSFGQVFTPFASVRGDVAALSVKSEPGVSNYLPTGESSPSRLMPAVGVEYRYPFISVHSWGTQTIEPIAQLIVRPNESRIGDFPNEDSQSLVFDDSNLFRVDKFSGWDRVEGGTRVNYGAQYTAQFNRAGFVNVLFGQSYQLLGTNSFAVGDATNTGLNSGLETRLSDYVARVSYQPNSIYTFTTRYRFDEETFAMRRFEAEARVNFDRWTLTALYGNYDAQPELGFLNRRQGVLGLGSVKLAQNWTLLGGARYDLEAEKFDQTRIGVGYVDDCLILAVNYITSYTYSGNPTADHSVMVQLGLRTLGDTAASQSVHSTSLTGP